MSVFSRGLVAWRKAEGLTQADLARLLAVTQQAISNWENGRDVPRADVLARVKSMMARCDELAIEQAFIRNQNAMRALFDFERVKLIGVSAGFAKIWLHFATMQGVALRDHLVNEMAHLSETPELRGAARRGEIVVASGVSSRHVGLDVDMAFKHRWFIRFRKFGHRMIGDIAFESCGKDDLEGVERLLSPDTVALK